MTPAVSVASLRHPGRQSAKKLNSCGKMQINTGGNVIACERGRALVLAAGPPGIVTLRAVSAERAQALISPPCGTPRSGCWRASGPPPPSKSPPRPPPP
jgi:hypothetical protein